MSDLIIDRLDGVLQPDAAYRELVKNDEDFYLYCAWNNSTTSSFEPDTDDDNIDFVSWRCRWQPGNAQ
tara:strand:- start:378 stop:581 length:204 start_codon:yes stop_codon:yes gene_type:complete